MKQSRSRLKIIAAVLFFPLRSHLARLGINYDLSAITNDYYREKFDSIPAAQKAVILPHCLIGDKCPARFSKGEGIVCSKCRKCACGEIRVLAEEQGWQFYISPSTGFTKRLVQRKAIRAAVGAACTFEIEKGIRSTPVGTKGVHLQQEKVIPQMILTARYDCVNNEIDWEQLKRIIRG
ncbi:MAG: hypothetical protein CVU54_02230 [Deltaproteobacteria bacterium HGW-Deltaproteobacteria-12]|jgi:hypothetical protein|nr:MAG: hypothetical protein CVU54_02230 [Deltaproteobacteria bacterium HGW-Deltaproteobacteria-12]